jgi:hypothetical protein
VSACEDRGRRQPWGSIEGEERLESLCYCSLLDRLLSMQFDLVTVNCNQCRSQWPRGLRRGSAADRLLELCFSNPAGGMDVCLL